MTIVRGAEQCSAAGAETAVGGGSATGGAWMTGGGWKKIKISTLNELYTILNISYY